jgi:methyl-accepting chemotaxis protein
MRFGIKRQLLAVCLVTVVAVGAVGMLGVHAGREIRRRAAVSYVDYTVALRTLAAAGGEVMAVAENLERAHTPGKGDAKNQAEIEEASAAVDKLIAAYGATTLRTTKTGRSERADLEAFQAAWADLQKLDEQLDEPARRAAADPAAIPALAPFLDRIAPALAKVDQAYNRLVETVGMVAEELEGESKAAFASDEQFLLLITAATVLLVLVTGVMQAIRLSRRLAEGVAVLQANSKDVTQAATEVATASQNLAQGSATQAASIEETSARSSRSSTRSRSRPTCWR